MIRDNLRSNRKETFGLAALAVVLTVLFIACKAEVSPEVKDYASQMQRWSESAKDAYGSGEQEAALYQLEAIKPAGMTWVDHGRLVNNYLSYVLAEQIGFIDLDNGPLEVCKSQDLNRVSLEGCAQDAAYNAYIVASFDLADALAKECDISPDDVIDLDEAISKCLAK
jgi:hypothetical protein